jgi:hypothetical protein
LQLHLVKLGLGCFCCLGLDCLQVESVKVAKTPEKSEKVQIFLLAEDVCFWVSRLKAIRVSVRGQKKISS